MRSEGSLKIAVLLILAGRSASRPSADMKRWNPGYLWGDKILLLDSRSSQIFPGKARIVTNQANG